MSMEEHVFDQLPAYSLGSLDKDETQQIDRHLEGCSLCRAELRTYQAVTDQLGLASPQFEPPPALKQKVLSGVVPARSTVISEPRKFDIVEFFRSMLTPWRLAGSVLVLALLASNLFLWQQVHQIRTTPGTADFQTIALAGTNADPQARGLVVISQDGAYGTLVVQNLTPLDTNHQYQLWLIQNGQLTNGGVFSVSEYGYTSILVYSPLPLNTYTSFGITIEPTGGSPQPTGSKVLGGGL